MTDHHAEAWYHVEKHIFGDVIEVTTKPNWGFKQDDSKIETVPIDQFLLMDEKVSTIILHILYGEGTDTETVLRVIQKAKRDCVKLIILEHNPEHWKSKSIGFIRQQFDDYIEENWGRNLLIAATTMFPLSIPQLSDSYHSTHINRHFAEGGAGMDQRFKVYTHTSEQPINFKLPEGRIYWVIGGGLAYESMDPKNENILFDSSLRQVLYCAFLYQVELWKLKRMYPVDRIEALPKNTLGYTHWRIAPSNGTTPDLILHKDIESLQTDDLVYVSTLPEEKWNHLPYVIESVQTRDKPVLRHMEGDHGM